MRNFKARILKLEKNIKPKKTQVACGRARVANVILYFGTHLEPAALRAYAIFPLSH